MLLHCGDYYNFWVEKAVKFLPEEIFHLLEDKIAFFSTAQRDGCRIARHICKNREIILLSERILPKKRACEDQREVRYFIFAVLHEIVHAFKKHPSPLYDNLTQKEAAADEKEADDLALSWHNEFIEKRNNPYLKPLTIKEINEIRAENIKLMEKLYENS